jgi:hypothetical protein
MSFPGNKPAIARTLFGMRPLREPQLSLETIGMEEAGLEVENGTWKIGHRPVGKSGALASRLMHHVRYHLLQSRWGREMSGYDVEQRGLVVYICACGIA